MSGYPVFEMILDKHSLIFKNLGYHAKFDVNFFELHVKTAGLSNQRKMWTRICKRRYVAAQ